ncbi:MAG TPA: squalene/phytoene synthase family protein [Pirellulaceae bacterium]|nr:squalene/phytoene synthase family protein [Pirellulaceae bacterium]
MPSADANSQLNAPPKTPITDALIERGYHAAIRKAKQFCHPLTWSIFNLPGDQQRGLMAWFAHLATAWDIMHRREKPRITEDSADALRVELDDGFSGKCAFPVTAAVVDTVNRFHVPKQYLFEVLHGADLVYRFPQTQTYEQLLPILAKLGGGTACGALVILGAKPGFEIPAIRFGQALLLSYWLIQLDSDLLARRYRLAQHDFAECQLPLNELTSDNQGQALGYFARLYGQRIEHLFQESQSLGDYLEFDALRSITALVDVVWETVVQIMLDPFRLMDHRPLVTRFPHFRKQKWKFYLGIEPAQPFISNHHAAH